MNTAGRLLGYVAILAAALFGAFGIGQLVGPVGPTTVETNRHEDGRDTSNDKHSGRGGDHAATSGPTDFEVDGRVHTAGFGVEARGGSGTNGNEEGNSHDHGE
ncbi:MULTISPECIES: hypothetical protein [Prauserella salsuginis group]|uniref:Uncharacterized protein n=2 Tax=Prauserella salsuginis group TaxID=2893672 RepID=A0A839XIR7_9PSEU|nr:MULTISPECIES: hypothetical protein [Prauserella salsuginis group]MBB3661649.1 hypothetical protein [Prauserella sediminis]MCR3719562.1 hypothetical protein [Prauserella flava]MCR3735424.1 hypothetical protein [Prauserella salsuginis]